MRQTPDCAPCMLRDCPIDHRCMTDISPDDVYQRARALLSDRLQIVGYQHSQSPAQANDKLKSVGQLK